jgi:D-alanine transaminase
VLPGVTRDLVLSLAHRAGLRAREERIRVARLARADEAFLTASTVEILPVVRCDGRAMGGGVPGPVTQRLQDAYRRRVRRALARSPRWEVLPAGRLGSATDATRRRSDVPKR